MMQKMHSPCVCRLAGINVYLIALVVRGCMFEVDLEKPASLATSTAFYLFDGASGQRQMVGRELLEARPRVPPHVVLGDEQDMGTI